MNPRYCRWRALEMFDSFETESFRSDGVSPQTTNSRQYCLLLAGGCAFEATLAFARLPSQATTLRRHFRVALELGANRRARPQSQHGRRCALVEPGKPSQKQGREGAQRT